VIEGLGREIRSAVGKKSKDQEGINIVFLTLEQAEEYLFKLYMKYHNRFRFKFVLF
jgi:hypothetical protein